MGVLHCYWLALKLGQDWRRRRLVDIYRYNIIKFGTGSLDHVIQVPIPDFSTPAGAAGFRKQLYNCISCDKNIAMRVSKPILPEPSAFPARISLRPHTSYNLESTRRDVAAAHEGKSLPDPLRREGSMNYSSKVVEKELERRKKLKENRLRQEINTHR